MAGALDGLNQIFIALLSKALERHDVCAMLIEMENIHIVMDQAMTDQLFQGLLTETLDI